MIAKESAFKLGLFFLIFVPIVIFIYYKKADYSANHLYKTVTIIPQFDAIDVNGLSINRKNVHGKYLYVQFIDSNNYEDIKLINSIYKIWLVEDLVILAFTNDVDKLKIRSGLPLNNILVVEENYEIIKRIFRSPKGTNTYYIFDKEGNLYNSDRNSIGYENGPKRYLDGLIKNRFFKISRLFQEKDNITHIDWYEEIKQDVLDGGKEINVIALFSSLCGVCKSGTIIEYLNRISRGPTSPFILGIISRRYSKESIETLKSQLSIEFPIVISGPKLSNIWDLLINEFREIDLNNIIVIFNKKGKIIKLYHQNCNCSQSFFRYLTEIHSEGIKAR